MSSSSAIELRNEPQAERARPRGTSLPGWLAWVGLGALLVAGAALCLWSTRGSTLTFDEWNWALGRRGFSAHTFLATYNGHFSLVPLILVKALYATFGLGHYLPYRIMITAGHLLVVGLVFAYARPRVGAALGLLAAAWILFLGPAWQNFLWPFQIAWLISIAAGIGALLALDRDSRRGEVAACVLLLVSLASSGLGVAVAVGIALEVIITRRRSAWIVVIPLVLFALWWIGFQHTSTTAASIRHAPGFAARMAASTVAALAGLAGSSVPFGSGTLLRYGPPLAVALVLGLAWALGPGGRASVRVFALLAIVVAFWVTAGLGRAGVSQPYSSRYLYVGATFLVLTGVELLRGVRVAPVVAAVAAVLIVAAIVSNLGQFSPAHAFLSGEAQATRADLAALDIGRPAVAPGYAPVRFPGFGYTFPASTYYAMERDIGTPAATPAQLLGLPEGPRETADLELLSIHRVALTPTSHTGQSCRSAQAPVDLALPAGGLLVRGTGPAVSVSARRFANRFSPVGTFAGTGARMLRIGPDRSSVPWQVRVTSSGRFELCSLVASAAP